MTEDKKVKKRKKLMTETLRHREAFEYYYSLGHDRSLEKVAEKFKVTSKTTYTWSADFGWQDRLILRDKAISEKLTEATDAAIVNEKSKLINITKASIARYVEALKETRTLFDKDGKPIPLPKVSITNPSTFIELTKLYLQLLGESAEEQINIIIEDARANEPDKKENQSNEAVQMAPGNDGQD